MAPECQQASRWKERKTRGEPDYHFTWAKVENDMSTRAEQLCAEIADAILSGELTPGSRLDEQGLADRYQVSRTPVREALRLLAATGLIEVRPRRGAAAQLVPGGEGHLRRVLAAVQRRPDCVRVRVAR
jgi:DNA-binding transcriptional MocR family regulator